MNARPIRIEFTRIGIVSGTCERGLSDCKGPEYKFTFDTIVLC